METLLAAAPMRRFNTSAISTIHKLSPAMAKKRSPFGRGVRHGTEVEAGHISYRNRCP